jgi:hypothetical protein
MHHEHQAPSHLSLPLKVTDKIHIQTKAQWWIHELINMYLNLWVISSEPIDQLKLRNHEKTHNFSSQQNTLHCRSIWSTSIDTVGQILCDLDHLLWSL